MQIRSIPFWFSKEKLDYVLKVFVCMARFLKNCIWIVFYAFIAGVTSDPDALKRQKTGRIRHGRYYDFDQENPSTLESKQGYGYLKAGSYFWKEEIMNPKTPECW